MLGPPASNAHSRAGAAGLRCCALLRPGPCLGAKKVLEASWRQKHAGSPRRRDRQADTPGLQLYPGSSLEPNEFHRVSGCSLAGGRADGEPGHPAVGPNVCLCAGQGAVLLGPDQGRDIRTSVSIQNLQGTSQLPPLLFQGRPFCSLLHPSVFSRDQVLRVLAKDEEQLSLLRDLEGLKPQKVRTAPGLRDTPPREACSWAPCPPPPSQTCPPEVSASDHKTGKNHMWLLFRKGWGPLPTKLGGLFRR